MSRRSVRKALLAAIEHFGSERGLAAAIGYTQHAIWRSKSLGRVSPRMTLAIWTATGRKIKRHELCPDVFDPPTARTRSSEIRAAS